jgi:type III pantothenate kinase
MFFTVDVGNTNIVYVLYDGGKPVFEARTNTDGTRMTDQYAVFIIEIFRMHGVPTAKVQGAAVSSVVPTVTGPLMAAAKQVFGKDVNMLDISSAKIADFASLVTEPMGGDLLCAIVAAKAKYPLPCVVADLGTVTKMLIIDKDGVYIGGSLFPGVRISMESLSKSTALLPMFSMQSCTDPIDTTTIGCMRSGILYGMASMLDGMIEHFERQLGMPCCVVATGGHAPLITQYCKREMTYDRYLVTDGIRYIYQMNQADRPL